MIVVVIGWVFLALPGVLRSRLARLHPARASKLVRASLVTGVALVAAGLLSMIAPTLLDGVGAHDLAATCRRLLHDVFSGGHLGGALAAVAFVGLFASILFSSLRLHHARRSAHVEAWVGHHRNFGGRELVIVPTTEPMAMASNKQVIVSCGLLEALNDAEMEMVVRHELAHLKLRHHHYLAIAAAVGSALGWLPYVGSSLRALRLAVERWADEVAAGQDPDARRTLSSALVTAMYRRPAEGLAGFAEGDLVVERLRALAANEPARPTRTIHLLTGLLASVAATAWLLAVAVIGLSLVSAVGCSA